jgi:O-methyltransferase
MSEQMFRAGIVDPFNADEPLQKIYDEGIQAAQGGQMDNLEKRMRYFVLAQAAIMACLRFPHLDFAECGCFRGHSTYMLGKILQSNGFRGRLNVFDSFEGLSDFTKNDLSAFINTPNAIENTRKHFRSDVNHVAAVVKPFDFVDLFPGWIPARFSEVANRAFGFISIDVDLYQPIRDSLEFFYPRMCAGGIIYLDDYGFNDFPGARLAVDEFFAAHAPTLFLRMPFGSALAIK